jgi:hypothetical protein
MARLILILLAIAAIAAGWSYAWFWGAGELSARADNMVRKYAENGGRFECSNRRIEGFPFRIGIFCDGVSLAPSEGGGFDAQALRTAAQFYDPGHVVGELDGPGLLQLPDGRRFNLQWENLRASARLGLSGPYALSAELRRFLLAEGSGGTAESELAGADRLELHARKSSGSANDLDVAVLIAAFADPLERIPGLSLEADLTVEEIAEKLDLGFDPMNYIRENGLSAVARSIVLSPEDGGRLVLSGPFRISRAGLASGEIRIEATNLPLLGAFFMRLLPERRDLVGNIVSLLSAIVPEKGGESGPGKPISLTLTINEGSVSIGLIPVGDLPPLL